MKKKYTVEFKEEAVKLHTEQGYRQAEVCQRLGIADANLSRWSREMKAGRQAGKVPKLQSSAEQKELETLRKENKRLKLEREILKKAAAFFANEQN